MLFMEVTMPPKVRITKEEIVETALRLVRQGGTGALNARTLASERQCSTQPIFSNFPTMEALQHATEEAAYARYLSFLKKGLEDGKYPAYKAFGMSYILFAKEERELFRMLFMCDREGRDLSPTADFNASVDMIAKANGCTRETAERMHTEMWIFVHGVATVLVTSYLPLEIDMISEMMTDVYQGLRARLMGGDTV